VFAGQEEEIPVKEKKVATWFHRGKRERGQVGRVSRAADWVIIMRSENISISPHVLWALCDEMLQPCR
jgi:hypothetical protein